MISLENISLQFAGQKIFNDVSLLISPKDRIGLVGKNGAGKSTMLKMIIGQQLIDEGKVIVPGGIEIGYLPQQLAIHDTTSVLQEAESAFSEIKQLEKEIDDLNHELVQRIDYESTSYLNLAHHLSIKNERLNLLSGGSTDAIIEQTLMGLGFKRSDFPRPTSEFSGGWRMRIEIAKILLRSPDVLLLDEPTNHLDIESIQWLENFLKTFRGAVVLISHDKAFLDAITTRTVEISLARLYDYKAAYSKYVELRKEFRIQQLASYTNQQKQIQETQDFIERFRYKATKAVQVQSRIKQLDKIDLIEVEEEDLARINIRFPEAPRSGKIAFSCEGLTKRYGNHVILSEINLAVERGEKLAFVGRNGEGKTTLTRIIMNEIDYEGEAKIGHNINIGYFAQNQDELLNREITVLKTLEDVAGPEVRTKVRDILGAFLFRGEEVDKKVKVLSGGEKSRLSMAKLLLEPYNLLVLDEPTNHLDMRSKDILKQALIDYTGTLILVSHDREFLNGLTDKIYEFKDRKIKEFRCSIYEFLEKKRIENLNDLNQKVESENTGKEENISDQKITYLKRKEYQRELRKIENLVERVETEIEELEKMKITLDEQLSLNPLQNTDFFHLYKKISAQLEEKVEEWESVNHQLEEFKNSEIA